MASQSRFLKWLDQVRENLTIRKERRLAELNQRERRNKNNAIDSKKVIEAYVAPPPFLLYLWSVLPLLLVSTLQKNAIIAGVIASALNLIIIHLDTFLFVRFLLSTVVLIAVIAIYQLALF